MMTSKRSSDTFKNHSHLYVPSVWVEQGINNNNVYVYFVFADIVSSVFLQVTELGGS